MKRTQPTWLDKNLFPFDSKWIEIEGDDLHYIDEGQGETILFIHGTPEWSFGYRDVLKELKQSFRCIAVDMLGFGLSNKPANGKYKCQDHARRLELFINKLSLQNFSIVANDFGGGIGLSYAIANQNNITNVFLFNTWMWSLKNDRHYAGAAGFMNTWLGEKLYLNFNFPVTMVMPAAFGNKKRLTNQIHSHYKNALPKGQRHATYVLSQELINASDWWQELWMKADLLVHKSVTIFWGMKDKFIPPYELDKWKQKFPNADIVIFKDAGHFVQEEEPVQMATKIREKLNPTL